MGRNPVITIGNFAKEVFCIYTDGGDEHYGWLNSAYLWPPISMGEHNDLDGLQGGMSGQYYHLTSGQVASLHARQHPITGTADHMSAATPDYILKADSNGLPIQATNTDAEVAAAVNHIHYKSIVIVTNNYDILTTDETIICDSVTPFSVALPVSDVGMYFNISSVNTGGITLTPHSGEVDTIDDEVSQPIGQWENITVLCIAANTWKIQ